MKMSKSTSENPGRETMAECRWVEAELHDMIAEIVTTSDLGLRFEAGADLVHGLFKDASLEGIQSALHDAGQLLLGNRKPCFEGCFDTYGHMGVDDLDNDLPIERMCLMVALVKQSSVRKWLLTSLVACARHDVDLGAWRGPIEWFLRQAEGHVDWAQTVMGDVHFKVDVRPVEVVTPPTVDTGNIH